MATPDEEITGYGGQPHTGPSTSSSSDAPRQSSAPATEDMKNKARETKQQVTEQVKTQGRAQFERYRGTAADEVEKVAQSVKAAASELENQDRAGLSQYVTSAAQYMTEFADDIRQKNADELFRDVNRMARNNPGLFIAGAVALGFGLMRFAKASGERTHTGDYGSHRMGHAQDGRSGRYGDADHLPSQYDLDDHLSSGAGTGSVGSVSNAGQSEHVGQSTPTRPLSVGPTGTQSPTGGTSFSGTSSTTGRNGKGTDGGLLP